MANQPLTCVFCKRYLLGSPRQAPCGDRLCGECYSKFEGENEKSCPFCQETIFFAQCFRDKAVEHELADTTVNCTNEGCPWDGLCINIEEHLSKCKFAQLPCPNGCGEVIRQSEMQNHLQNNCPAPRPCSYCNESIPKQQLNNHLEKDCEKKPFYCPNQCGFQLIRKEWLCHSMICPQRIIEQYSCFGCNFKGMPAGFNEMALMVQTLQATSYNGTFIWKVPEVQRKRHEALIGKTISLYSAPFYTSRHGYQLCLRLYMDGDGSGKGTHLSFFLTVMKGEFDALLQWPFKLTVTLTLLDQDKCKDIIQSFHPEPTSSSFQRPQNEMNVASGCPLFAPLSVLNSSSYVKQDTMFLKCQITE